MRRSRARSTPIHVDASTLRSKQRQGGGFRRDHLDLSHLSVLFQLPSQVSSQDCQFPARCLWLAGIVGELSLGSDEALVPAAAAELDALDVGAARLAFLSSALAEPGAGPEVAGLAAFSAKARRRCLMNSPMGLLSLRTSSALSMCGASLWRTARSMIGLSFDLTLPSSKQGMTK